MKQVDGTALLVTISEDLSNEPVLKVWALDKIEKKTGAPKCLSTLGIQNGRRQFPVCTSPDELGFEKLRTADIGFCRARGSFSARNWVRQRICDGGKRGLDS